MDEQRCPDPVCLRGWIRTRSISDRIRNAWYGKISYNDLFLPLFQILTHIHEFPSNATPNKSVPFILTTFFAFSSDSIDFFIHFLVTLLFKLVKLDSDINKSEGSKKRI